MLYPLTFQPIFKERVWGGQKIRQLYSKKIPQGLMIGESWEISDHADDVSVITNGPLAGKNLRWLMENHHDELLGAAKDQNGRFPLLIKILDAREKLSLQVHPPESAAAKLGGEPKTEMWFVADAAPDAEIFVGLKRNTSRAEFEEKIRDGTVEECFHRIHVKVGDAMFLPSGRVHAVGAGLVLFEIQQNSDTTYRVFDWNRVGLDGKPRELHVKEALVTIDFGDYEPELVGAGFENKNGMRIRPLADNPLFSVELCNAPRAFQNGVTENRMQIIGVVSGELSVVHEETELKIPPGEFCLLPASLSDVKIRAEKETSFLRIEAGQCRI